MTRSRLHLRSGQRLLFLYAGARLKVGGCAARRRRPRVDWRKLCGRVRMFLSCRQCEPRAGHALLSVSRAFVVLPSSADVATRGPRFRRKRQKLRGDGERRAKTDDAYYRLVRPGDEDAAPAANAPVAFGRSSHVAGSSGYDEWQSTTATVAQARPGCAVPPPRLSTNPAFALSRLNPRVFYRSPIRLRYAATQQNSRSS